MERARTIKTWPCEVLTFQRGDYVATIATNGQRHVSQEPVECQVCREHITLKKAIAYLEAKGYKIVTSNYKSL